MSEPPELPSSPKEEDSSYQEFAETIGMVPSVKKKDNLIQGIVILITTSIGAFIGYSLSLEDSSLPFILGGALVGLIVGTFLSGFTLMVIGWKRAAKRKKNQQPN